MRDSIILHVLQNLKDLFHLQIYNNFLNSSHPTASYSVLQPTINVLLL